MTSLVAEANSPLAADELRERITLLFEQSPFALISNFIISIGLVLLLWGSGQQNLLLNWLLACAVLTLGRWMLVRRFLRRPSASSDLRGWSGLYVLSAFLSGCLLGAAGILFFQGNLYTLYALAIVLMVMSIGSVMMNAASTPVHLAFVIPILVPFALRCLMTDDFTCITVGLIVLLYLPVNLLLHRKTQRGLLKSVRLRLHNQKLIEALTQQKQIAENARAMAEQANADKTRFFASASHDLRQPVQALELFSAALEFELEGSSSHPLVSQIRAAGRELSDMLNALLDFSEIDVAGAQPVLRAFPVATLLNRMADDFVPQAAARGLRCRVAPCSAWLHSDPLLLERILRNFMHNAIKYTPKGSVLLGCRRVGQGLRIEVHDTGIGIHPSRHKEVFQEFVQIDNPERDRQKGLGLGLAIVQGLARLLAHPLSLRSVPRRGSIFAVTVPLGTPVVDHAPEIPTAWIHTRSGAGAVIVLIEDDLAIRDGAAQLLGNWGYHVLAAESAEQALALLQTTGGNVDVILADYRLREGFTGLQAIHLVQAHCGRAVPAAIISGDTAPELLAQVRSAGFPLLKKPLSAAKLRTLILNLLRNRGREAGVTNQA